MNPSQATTVLFYGKNVGYLEFNFTSITPLSCDPEFCSPRTFPFSPPSPTPMPTPTPTGIVINPGDLSCDTNPGKPYFLCFLRLLTLVSCVNDVLVFSDLSLSVNGSISLQNDLQLSGTVLIVSGSPLLYHPFTICSFSSLLCKFLFISFLLVSFSSPPVLCFAFIFQGSWRYLLAPLSASTGTHPLLFKDV